ncbi:MAG: glucosaminidase domain-containing protein [Hyphomicrobiales bacterium]
MLKLNYNLLIVFIIISISSSAQKKITHQEYIERYKDIAIKKMKEDGIPASITLGQGIFESGIGNSKLARYANNHFGIKCHKSWKGKKYYQNDDAKNECFRKYKNPEKSFEDHSNFLTTRSRYAFLFKYKSNDYKRWAHGLKKAGYATNPKYAHRLINIIEKYNLHQFDNPNYKKKETHKEETISGNEKASLYTELFRPNPINFKLTKNKFSDRKIYVNNRRKFIFVEKGDTFYGISKEFEIYTWQVYKYNDLKKDDIIYEGQMIYLEKKRKRCKHKVHTAKDNETLYQIAQYYGLRLKKLKRLNKNYDDQPLKEGMIIYLK